MSYEFYKLLHILGIIAVFLSFGGAIISQAIQPNKKYEGKKLVAITHGVGLLLILVAGFGLLAKAKIGWDGWVFVKLGIWVAVGGLVTLIYKKPNLARVWWLTLITLGGAAAFLAIYKPF